MKKHLFLLTILGLLQVYTHVQAQVGIGTATPAASAKLELSSTTQGFLPPRMTTAQRDRISNPAEGLIIFNTDFDCLDFKSSTGWVTLTTSATINYPSVLIGSQYWMVNNLELTTYRNGDIIPYVSNPTAWNTLNTGAWCYYNNDPSSGYGKLYNWYAVNDPRGLAPTGWHVPSDAEWTTLTTTLGGEAVAGHKLKLTGNTRWSCATGTNSNFFSALPGGYRDLSGSSWNLGSEGDWWSATEIINTTTAKARQVYCNWAWVDHMAYYKVNGLSVRCVKD